MSKSNAGFNRDTSGCKILKLKMQKEKTETYRVTGYVGVFRPEARVFFSRNVWVVGNDIPVLDFFPTNDFQPPPFLSPSTTQVVFSGLFFLLSQSHLVSMIITYTCPD